MVLMDRQCSSSIKSDYSSSLAINDDDHNHHHHHHLNHHQIHHHEQHHEKLPPSKDIAVNGPQKLDNDNDPHKCRNQLHHKQIPNQNKNQPQSQQHHHDHCHSISPQQPKNEQQQQQLETSRTEITDSIILYPFDHQVGGHTQLLTLDKATLCKPLIPRELLFYMNVPKELVKFLPAYKGVVQIRENGTGSYPPLLYQPLRSPKSPFSRYGHSSSCTLPAKLNVSIRQCSDEKILRKNLSEENLLASNYISRPNEKYLLLLENVAANYQFPCILDLKMGTRQHGDDATEEKRHRQIAKCQASTSASLGVRLCGMQVYQVDHGGFLWYDKYYGRKMNEDGLKRALHQYFHNGFQINKDIIDDVIARLRLLSNAVERSPSFRFYGTSLLIIHEGCTRRSMNNDCCSVDVRLIDFAHTICDYSQATPSNNSRSSSSPCVLRSSSVERLRSDYSQLDQISSSSSVDLNPNPNTTTPTTSSTPIPTSRDITNPSPNVSEPTDCDQLKGDDGIELDRNDHHKANANPKLQTTLANTTNHDYQENNNNHDENDHKRDIDNNNIVGIANNDDIEKISSTRTSVRQSSRTMLGPDKGLLFGLQNLMRLLEDLKDDYLDNQIATPNSTSTTPTSVPSYLVLNNSATPTQIAH